MSSIRTLRDDYGPRHPFNAQIGWLIDNGQDHLRRMRVDGDSFYRSVAFACVEKILHAQDPRQEVKRAVEVLDSTRLLLEVAGFQPSLYEDSLAIFQSIVQQIVTPDINGETMTPEILLEAFQHPEVSNSVVLYFRLLTAAQIRAEPESYIPYLIDFQLEPMQFCEKYVQEMGVPADEVQIAALSRALGVTVEVGQLQDHTAAVAASRVKFVAYQGTPAVHDSNSSPIVLLNRLVICTLDV
ncbi:cysteine proteinase [Athelia psychrophila]|uniref:ubiquitinyl hydrolase 1 n=1 Tax=Athelia psychrophila TaxID=1759441 RepID=A0A166SZT3_9AGAM|nr:cysteine proteinase [Fibularhizoctonia sp. CBS 109695]